MSDNQTSSAGVLNPPAGASAGENQGGAANGQPSGTPASGEPTPFYATFTDPGVQEFVKSKGFNDVNALATSAYHANRHISGAKDVIAIPADPTNTEAMSKVYKALGQPEKATDYTFTHAEGITPDPKFVGFAQNAFHKHGLNPAQAQGIVSEWNTFVTEVTKAQDTAAQQQVEALKTQMGAAKFDATVAEGQRMVKALGLSDDILNGLDAKLGGPAAVIQLMAAIGSKLGGKGGSLIEGSSAAPAGMQALDGMSAEQARTEIRRLQTDQEFVKALREKGHPQHKEKTEYWRDLHKVGHGG